MRYDDELEIGTQLDVRDEADDELDVIIVKVEIEHYFNELIDDVDEIIADEGDEELLEVEIVEVDVIDEQVDYEWL